MVRIPARTVSLYTQSMDTLFRTIAVSSRFFGREFEMNTATKRKMIEEKFDCYPSQDERIR